MKRFIVLLSATLLQVITGQAIPNPYSANAIAANTNLGNALAANANLANGITANNIATSANLGNVFAANANIASGIAANNIAANANIGHAIAANANIANGIAANNIAASANLGNAFAANANIASGIAANTIANANAIAAENAFANSMAYGPAYAPGLSNHAMPYGPGPFPYEVDIPISPACGVPGLNYGLSLADLTASHGSGLRVMSSSPLAPSGVTVQSDNMAVEGPLSVSGQVPFLGVVAVEGPLPAMGQGAVGYGCGNGNVGMVSEGGEACPGQLSGPYRNGPAGPIPNPLGLNPAFYNGMPVV